MSEVGEQLVSNEDARGACMRKARRVLLDLVTMMASSDEETLAELDIDGAKNLLDSLSTHKETMRRLRREYKRLRAAKAAE